MSALITGASAGIGREFARQLAGRARLLILVARREQELNDLRDELRRQYPNLTVHIRKTDLADLVQIKELMAWLDYEKIDVDLLINNAGLGDYRSLRDEQSHSQRANDARKHGGPYFSYPPFASTNDCEKTRRHLEREFVGWLSSNPGTRDLCRNQSVCHQLLRSAPGRTSWNRCERLRSCPGPVHTEFQGVAKRPDGERQNGPEFVHVSVEQVVREASMGLEADRPLVIPGLQMKIVMFLVRITPIPILRLASRFSAKRP